MSFFLALALSIAQPDCSKLCMAEFADVGMWDKAKRMCMCGYFRDFSPIEIRPVIRSSESEKPPLSTEE